MKRDALLRPWASILYPATPLLAQLYEGWPIDDVARGHFEAYAARCIDEGLRALTGRP